MFYPVEIRNSILNDMLAATNGTYSNTFGTSLTPGMLQQAKQRFDDNTLQKQMMQEYSQILEPVWQKSFIRPIIKFFRGNELVELKEGEEMSPIDVLRWNVYKWLYE
jgi:hypothetical protein